MKVQNLRSLIVAMRAAAHGEAAAPADAAAPTVESAEALPAVSIITDGEQFLAAVEHGKQALWEGRTVAHATVKATFEQIIHGVNE